MEINLISDTVTKPSPEMLQAMFNAKVGDDVFKQDPTVNAFEKMVADLFGMEAALFFPTGTMANQTAIKLNTNPGTIRVRLQSWLKPWPHNNCTIVLVINEPLLYLYGVRAIQIQDRVPRAK